MRTLRACMALLLALAATFGGAAAAETIETRDGQRFKGTVVGETPTSLTLEGRYGTLRITKRDIVKRTGDTHKLRLADGTVVVGEILEQTKQEVILKTANGALTIPAKEIRWIDDELSPAAKKLHGDPQLVLQLHSRASRLHNQKQYRRAIAVYHQLLELAPDDAIALYNVACGYSLLNEREDAVDYLERSVMAGFSDFTHMREDSDLDNIRHEPGYLRLIADQNKWLRKAAAKKTVRLLRELRSRGATGHYKVFVDKAHNIIWLHTKTAAQLAKIRARLDRYAEIQWRDLFRNRLREPLHIVLLTRHDGPSMLAPNVGGFFRPSTNTLICGDLPSFKLTGSSVTIHEFTHALHFADQEARHEEHPIWFVEGLATLFESSRVIDGKLVPRQSARLTTVQRALRMGRAIPWRRLMQMSHTSFMNNASLAYAESRYILFYLWQKGLLKTFYDDFTTKANFQGDKTAEESFEVAFGRPLEEVEAAWKVWIQEQSVPPIPFIGIRSEPAKNGSRIAFVVPGSGAAKAKLQVGDVLLSGDGMPIKNPGDVLEVLSTHDVGDTIVFKVLRGKQTLHVRVTLGKRQ